MFERNNCNPGNWRIKCEIVSQIVVLVPVSTDVNSSFTVPSKGANTGSAARPYSPTYISFAYFCHLGRS